FDDSFARQFAHADDVITVVHSIFLNAVHNRVGFAAAPVELGRMNMNHQRFAGHTLGMKTSWVGEPVVSMYDIEGVGTGDHPCHDRVVVGFLQDVVRVPS